MSSGFILILVLWGGQGVSVTTQKFANEKYCQQAGETALQMVKGAWASVRYSCVPAGA